MKYFKLLNRTEINNCRYCEFSLIGILFAIYFLLVAVYVDAESLSYDSLTVRNAYAMAYNENEQVVMLFGGADEKRVLNDLWIWNGYSWKCISRGGPTPRTFASIAFDRERNALIIFGGNRVLFGSNEDTNTILNDMWMWHDSAWYKINCPMPPARAEACMTYDSERNCLVLFGGYQIEKGERKRLGDTWEWKGEKWEEKHPANSPYARSGAAMTYDPDRKKVVLFGGSGNADDTWEWDGENWTQVKSAVTDKRFNSAMAYDEKNQVIIRFGGWIEGERVCDTWKYNGIIWKKITNKGPSNRNHTSMVYDKSRGVIVLFGGHDDDQVFGDTWEWDGKQWMLRSKTEPRLRVNNGH